MLLPAAPCQHPQRALGQQLGHGPGTRVQFLPQAWAQHLGQLHQPLVSATHRQSQLFTLPHGSAPPTHGSFCPVYSAQEQAWLPRTLSPRVIPSCIGAKPPRSDRAQTINTSQPLSFGYPASLTPPLRPLAQGPASAWTGPAESVGQSLDGVTGSHTTGTAGTGGSCCSSCGAGSRCGGRHRTNRRGHSCC